MSLPADSIIGFNRTSPSNHNETKVLDFSCLGLINVYKFPLDNSHLQYPSNVIHSAKICEMPQNLDMYP